MASSLQDFAAKAQESKANVAHFFKPVDKGSAMPSWYNQTHLEELEERVKSKERQLKNDLVPQDKIMRVKTELTAERTRLNEIKSAQTSVQNMVQKDPGKYAKRLEELREEISESYYTRDQMFRAGKDRSASPRMEAEKMPHRNELIREYKIIARCLDEDPNPERLRKGK